MPAAWQTIRQRIRAFGWLCLLAACSGDRATIFEQSIELSTLEEEAVTGVLVAPDGSSGQQSLRVTGSHHGSVSLDSTSGKFVFEPAADFFGVAGFTALHFRGSALTGIFKVSVTVENVNDAPRIDPIPDLTNSPLSATVDYTVAVFDPDFDTPSLSVVVTNPAVVAASIERVSGLLSLQALEAGESSIQITASDAQAESATAFRFTAEEFPKAFVLSFPDPDNGAALLKNVSESTVDFVLEHNGFPVFEDIDHVVAYVEGMPEQFEGENFGHKLWRFVRESVYHDVPLSAEQWLYDPWVTVNSLGWGFCGNVAAAFVEVARAAGYPARVWGLSGHVVPEIEIDGRWVMYDPDLSVFYRDANGQVAGVEQLAADPGLITAPNEPIYSGSSYSFPYSEVVADIYASQADNFDGSGIFLATHERPSSRIVLPPQAELIYPGRWTEAPTGYDGDEPYTVRHFRQAMLRLADGWVGTVTLPWLVWDVLGSGQAGVGGEAYEIGSSELTDRLRNTDAPITTLEIYAGSAVRIVYLINGVRFDIRNNNTISVRSLWPRALDAAAVELSPEHAAGEPIDAALRKPRPTSQP